MCSSALTFGIIPPAPRAYTEPGVGSSSTSHGAITEFGTVGSLPITPVGVLSTPASLVIVGVSASAAASILAQRSAQVNSGSAPSSGGHRRRNRQILVECSLVCQSRYFAESTRTYPSSASTP
ncbi:hypothetical protein PC121_g21256 [Phytophthora cactorum]|nr:hypothetical protein PC121_g21256 [Phytophthora cactorum]